MEITTDLVKKGFDFLDQLSQIKIDSARGIETIFITDRFLPNKEDIKRCYFNNKLLNKKEAIKVCEQKSIKLPLDIDKYDFFVYHKSLGVISFQKGDFIMTDEGYLTTDGEKIICYDNTGDELGSF